MTLPFEFKIISFEDFQIKCNKGFCLRGTLKSNQCIKDLKQRQCYTIYVKQQKKKFDKQFSEVDYEWEQLKEEIKLRDNSCLLTKILTNEELKIVELQEGYWLNQKFVDGAHIIPRAVAPKNIYNRNNVILLGRFFHSRIDNHLDPVTGEFIGIEGTAKWWERILKQNGLWNESVDYWDFRKRMVEE